MSRFIRSTGGRDCKGPKSGVPDPRLGVTLGVERVPLNFWGMVSY